MISHTIVVCPHCGVFIQAYRAIFNFPCGTGREPNSPRTERCHKMEKWFEGNEFAKEKDNQ